MNPDNKPISELISSETPVDTTTPPIGVDIPAAQPGVPGKRKTSKAFPIIVGFLLVLIIGVGGYYVYSNYIKEEPVEETTEETTSEDSQVSETEEVEKEDLSNTYTHNPEIGEIDTEYVGSWLGCALIEESYCQRYVLFDTGNYLYFPSEMEEVEEYVVEIGIWGVEEGELSLAKDADITNIVSIALGEIEYSSAEESSYSLKANFGETTYWLVSKETNIWSTDTM
jgi:hypothetical protein